MAHGFRGEATAIVGVRLRDSFLRKMTQRIAGADAPQGLADEMHSAWISFIKTGDPGWPVFGTERNTRLFDTATATVPQRRTEALDLLP